MYNVDIFGNNIFYPPTEQVWRLPTTCAANGITNKIFEIHFRLFNRKSKYM